jgi:hypothetical protein
MKQPATAAPSCRRALLLAFGLSLALWMGPPSASAGGAAPLTIETRDYFVSKIGSFRPTRNATVSAATRAFGRPSRRQRTDRTTCRRTWGRLGLRIDFVTFGGVRPGQTACSRGAGQAQSFVARGPRFRTAKGLRVGQASSQIQALYPDAQFRDGSWALVLARFPFGGDELGPVLSAVTSGGQVGALAGYIGAAGE